MSNEPAQPNSHLPRLVVLVLLGVFIPFFVPPVGNRLEFWIYAAPYAQAIVGALIGLMIDLFLRAIEIPTSSPSPSPSERDVMDSPTTGQR
jgi:hypothetical protein